MKKLGRFESFLREMRQIVRTLLGLAHQESRRDQDTGAISNQQSAISNQEQKPRARGTSGLQFRLIADC